VLRNKQTLADSHISSLKHEKDDVREVRSGFECGIALKDFDDFEEGDILECYIKEVVKVE
jgi:translation initiation factor IF-2